jgi:asparagine synthase (glutamine-hydrolysing)
MMDHMRHRGPDDEGIFPGKFGTLAMRRLSIIDLAGGHQPVFNEDGTIAVVFNGEIHNFRELQRTLVSLGHSFRTNSDTEVIVHAYEEWGEDCVEHLDGMFAFAVADGSNPGPHGSSQILLARDRLGIKPLYYAIVDGKLLFASEVRSLLASGRIEPRLSIPALQSYLLFGSMVEPMTLVEGVFSLLPGHRMTISPDGNELKVRLEPYWHFGQAVHRTPAPGRLDRRSAAALLRSLLEETVESHLIADVPVGVFLSSGIDSTAVAALAAQRVPNLHTVTVAFREDEFSEAGRARRTADRLGSKHQELTLSGEDMLARLDEAVDAFDQPSMDGINSYFVSWAARQTGLKVALSGLGGDELFGGYPSFRATPRAESVARFARSIPGGLRSVTAGAFEKVCEPFRRDAARKIAALWQDPNSLPHPYFYTRLLFTPAQARGLLSSAGAETSIGAPHLFCPAGGVVGSAGEPWQQWLDQVVNESDQLDDFTAVSCLEMRSYMVNTLLRDTDAMSMAHSLEVRVPFLHGPLVEFVARLPGSLKSGNGVPKPLLVEAMGDLLPAEVVSQRKRTFTLPWEFWLRGPLKQKVESELNAMAPSLEPYLNGRAVADVWTGFQRKNRSWSRVWSLFVISRWARRHLGHPGNSEPVAGNEEQTVDARVS